MERGFQILSQQTMKILFLFAASVSLSGRSQASETAGLSVAATPRAESRHLQLRYLGREEGLSNQTVNCFCQDEFGFVWIGTQNGLNRFDGRTIDRFRPSDHAGAMCGNNIRQLFSDRRGHLFFRSQQSIERYDLRLNRFDLLYSGQVGDAAIVGDSLYMLSSSYILRIACNATAAKGREPTIVPDTILRAGQLGLESGSLRHLLITGDTLVVATSQSEVIRFAEGRVVDRRRTGSVNSLMSDEEGNLWVTTRDEGIYCIAPDGGMRHWKHRPGNENSLKHDYVRSMVSVGNGLYYIGTFRGLQLFDKRRECFIDCTYDLRQGDYNSHSVISMFYDDRGILWMGTFYCGVQYYDTAADNYRLYRTAADQYEAHTSSVISDMVEDDNGNVWFASEGCGLFRYDTETDSFSHVKGVLDREVVKALHFDSARHCLWAATLFHGIWRFDLDTGRSRRVPPEIYDADGRVVRSVLNIMKMIDDGEGGLLLATKWGIVRLNTGRMRLEEFELPGGRNRLQKQMWDILRDGSCIWATASSHLYRISTDGGGLHEYTFAEISGSKVKQSVHHLFRDSDGRIWVGSTGSGIFRYDPALDGFRSYGLAGGFITGFAERSGTVSELYAGHDSGIARLNETRQQFEDLVLDNNLSPFGVSEGGLFISKNGYLFFCGQQGIVRIRCSDFHRQPIDYNVYVRELLVDNQSVQPGDSTGLMRFSPLYQHHIALPPHRTSVTFRIASNDFRNMSTSRLVYRLEGFDSDFIPAGNSSTITYTNLGAGRYRFVVRGCVPDTRGAYPETTFELKVQAPFYRRALFLIPVICILLIVAISLGRLWFSRLKLRQSLLAEQREKERAEQVNQQKLRFFTNVSHEFRTPLTLITGQLELLLAQHDIRPSVYNRVLSAWKSVHRMNDMVDELIDIRRQEFDSLTLKLRHEDFAAFAREIWLTFSDHAAARRIDYRFDAPDEPVEVWFDRRQMEKVLNNLLSNAFKFTPDGGSVSLSLCRREETLCFAVSDSGIGIAPEHLDRVFERFWQAADSDAATESYGSGIGLSVAKSIVELHGGSIGVESRLHCGTTFSVRLSLARPEATPNRIFPPASVHSACYHEQPDALSSLVMADLKPDKRVKLLVVEDNMELTEFLRSFFEQIWEVRTAVDGAAGLEVARSWQPDLVLSDIMMPGMSGLEMCRCLKTEILTSHIPVVLLTARNGSEHEIEGLETGADDYIVKPFNLRILVVRCRNIVVQRQQWQARFRITGNCPPQSAVGSRDGRLLDRATQIVERYLTDTTFDVNLFAREIGMSRSLLYVKLKGLTGQTPNDFILSVRMKRSLVYLTTDPARSISEIAYDVGFSSPSYFSRCFREHFGMTPNDWRKTHTA